MTIMDLKSFFAPEEPLGLVLCGGGGKGAYQIGALSVLHRWGIDRYIKAVSGVSIGALNALLFAEVPLKKAEGVWRGVTQADFTVPNRENVFSADSEKFEHQGVLSKLSAIMKDPLGRTARYSQEGLERLIDDNIAREPEKLFRRGLRIVVTVSRLDPSAAFDRDHHLPLVTEYMELRGKTYEEIKNIVLASAALPFAFPPRAIGENYYYDGGALDNMPVRPLVRMGLKNIVIIHLRTADDPKEIDRRKDSFAGIDESVLNVFDIYPSDAGVLGDTMELSPEKTEWRLRLGKQDAERQLPLKVYLGGKKLV